MGCCLGGRFVGRRLIVGAIIASNMLNCLPASSITLQKFSTDIDIYKDTIISVAGFHIHKPEHQVAKVLVHVVSVSVVICNCFGYVNRKNNQIFVSRR